MVTHNRIHQTWGLIGRHITLKSDREPIIVPPMKSAGAMHEGTRMRDDSVAGEKGSAGVVERTVRTLRNRSKTIKYHVEEHIGQVLGSEMPIMVWFVRWVGMAWSRYHVGSDGKTGDENVCGR